MVRLAPPALAVAGVAAAAWLYFGGAYPNFDTAFAVVWGDELTGGGAPDYGVPSAPTPHPLATGLGALASLFGTGAYTAVAGVAFLSLGAFVWGAYRLGRECYSWRVGLLAALIVATSFTVLSRATASYFDLLAVALMVLAAGLEVRRPRNGAPVLILLTLAGLQRPEAWLLAGAYWLYLAPELGGRDRLRAGALAALAPAVWAAADLVVTGDPFYSFFGTRAVVAHYSAGDQDPAGVGLPVLLALGIGAIAAIFLLKRWARVPPAWLAAAAVAGTGMVLVALPEGRAVFQIAFEDLRDILRLPILIGSVGGAVVALLALRWRSRIPAAYLTLGLLAFLGLGFAGLPLVDRFLFLPAAMLALFFAVGALGWMDELPGMPSSFVLPARLRRAWTVGGVLLLAAFVISLPAQADRLEDLRRAVELRTTAVDDLRNLADSPRAGAALRRCPRVYFPNEQAIPFIAYLVDRSPRAILAADAGPVRDGAYLLPARALVDDTAFLLAHSDRVDPLRAPPGFMPVARNGSWRVLVKGCALPAAGRPTGAG